MQSSTGQYSTHAGDPAHPVQHSVMTANSFGFFFRGVARPLDLGSNLSSSGTIPAAVFLVTGSVAMANALYRQLDSAKLGFRTCFHGFPSHRSSPHTTISTCSFLL